MLNFRLLNYLFKALIFLIDSMHECITMYLFSSDHIGREIITRFDTGIKNNGTFYTDTNSRETLKRM